MQGVDAAASPAYPVSHGRSMRVLVVTDSSANVPDSYLASLGIAEVPAVVLIDGQSYLNKVELPVEAFYERLASASQPPTTAQPPPQLFLDAYRHLADQGAEALVTVTVTSELSGTYSSACVAAEDSPIPVQVWDSRHVSVGAGWQAIEAARAAAGGASVAQIIARLAKVRERMHLAFAPATLRYLIAGGRVAPLRGRVGEMLNVKPILVARDGLLEVDGQVRGRQRSIAEVLDRVCAGVGSGPAIVAVAHAAAPAEAEALLAEARNRIRVTEAFITDVGPALAAQAGPGVIGVCGFALEG